MKAPLRTIAALTVGIAGGVQAQGDLWRRVERIDLRPDGMPTVQRFALTDVSISDDGRWVIFASTAGDLVDGDDNARSDVFVRDRRTQTTRRLSLRPDGSQTSGASTAPSASADGRYVTFGSLDAQLVPGDTNFDRDQFLLDRDADGDGVYDEPGGIALTRIGVDDAGAQISGVGDAAGAVDDHGRHVAFATPHAIAGHDGNGLPDVYVRDRTAGTTRIVSESSTGVVGNGRSPDVRDAPIRISGDGRRIAFTSDASNLAPGDGNGTVDLFVRDRDADGNGILDESGGTATTRASLRGDGGALAIGADVQYALSRDGGTLAIAANDPTGPNPAGTSIFLRNLGAGSIVQLPFALAQWTKGDAGCCRNQTPWLSRGAAVTAFTSVQSYLREGITTTRSDVFVLPNNGLLTRLTDFAVPASLYDGDSYEAVALSASGAYLVIHHIKAGATMGPDEGYYVYQRNAVFRADFDPVM